MAVSNPTQLTTKKEAPAGTTTTTSAVAPNTGDLLLVRVAAWQFPTGFPATGVTWNGIALTLAVQKTGAGTQAKRNDTSVWYLQVATGASATVIVTFTGTNFVVFVEVETYTGFNTTTPIGATNTTEQENGSGVAPSLAVATSSGDMAVDALGSESGVAANVTIGAGQTLSYQDDDANSVGSFSYEAATGASVTMSWGFLVLDRNYTYCAAVIQQAAAGGQVPYSPWQQRGPVVAQ